MENDYFENMKEEETDIISYDKKIEECVWHLDDEHENELVKELETFVLDKPTLLMRKNPDTWYDEAVIVTPKVLEFLKSVEDPADVNFDFYINYSIRHGKFKDIDYNNEHEEAFWQGIPFISEDEFIKSEREANAYVYTEEEQEAADNLMESIKCAMEKLHELNNRHK